MRERIDDDSVSFATCPSDDKVKNLKLRYFFKKAMRDFLPPEELSNSKHGFGLSFNTWLRTEPGGVQQLAGDGLTSLKKHGYIPPNLIDNLIRQHWTLYGKTIWVLMVLQLLFAVPRFLTAIHHED